MKRGLIIAAVVLAAAFALLRGDSAPPQHVDAIFDSAKGMVPGQAVKVAGAKVGKVTAVHLVPTAGGGFKARLSLAVDRAVGGFHDDASCRIVPEGIISENSVDCDPGSPSRPPLSRGAGLRPVIGVAHTSAPASLQDVIETFATPTSERLRLIVNELGIATAGRGEDINAILLRTSPALRQTRATLAIINDNRAAIQNAVSATDSVIGELAQRKRDVHSFVARAARVTDATASRSAALQRGIERLPALLEAVDRAAGPIRTTVRAGTPVLADLRRAAPGLSAVTTTLPRFTSAAKPAAVALQDAARRGRAALPKLTPVISHLATLSRRVPPVARSLDSLLTSLRSTGGFESMIKFFYGSASVTSLYDRVSHIVTATVAPSPRCIAANLQPGKLTGGCSHAFSAPGLGTVPPSESPASRASRRTTTTDLRQANDFLDYLLG